MGANLLINSLSGMDSSWGIGNNSLINSFLEWVKYVKRAVPCEKFDHFFYFFKIFFVYLLKEVDFFS